MRIVGQNSDVHFGEVYKEEPDWRNELEEETDPDDEELEYTPQDVIDILGFDPKEFSEPEPIDNESNPMSLNTTKALLILNAKSVSKKGLGKTKGWTDEARAKAAMTRKAKKKALKPGTYAHTKAMMEKAYKKLTPEAKASMQKEYAKAAKVGVRRKKVTGKSGETAPKKKKSYDPSTDGAKPGKPTVVGGKTWSLKDPKGKTQTVLQDKIEGGYRTSSHPGKRFSSLSKAVEAAKLGSQSIKSPNKSDLERIAKNRERRMKKEQAQRAAKGLK